MKRFSKFIQESAELKEQKMTFQDAEKLKSKHLAAMQHHKKSGNSKGYAAHSMVVDKFEDAYDRHGTGVIPVGRIMSASQKAFKDHPHSSMKEEFEQIGLSESIDQIKKHHVSNISHFDKYPNGDTALGVHHQRMARLHSNAASEAKKAGNKKMADAHSDAANAHRSANGTVSGFNRAVEKTKKTFNEEVGLDEAVEVSHDRYMRSHGKKASGGHGMWMFTHKRMGDANVNDPKEVHSSSGKFSDAKKSAQQWAKKHGHSTVYVMEEVELDEAAPKMKGDWLKKERERNREHDAAMGRTPTGRKKPVRQMTSTQKSLAKMRGEEVELDEAEMSLYDKIKAARKNPSPDKPIRGRGSKNRNPKTYDVRNKLDKEDDYTQDLIKKRLQKKNEEVELDEVSDKKLDAYRQKAFADQPSGDDGSDKYRKRKFGRDLAFAKQTGRAKVLATKEEVELDEVSTEKLRDYASAALQDKNKAKAEKRWKYAGKAMQTVADREVKAAHARKYNKMEEVNLDEAKTDIYHKHMLKALGKSRLPKDHSYTSAIANNGDFVVKDGGGRTVGRIPKGEHNLKD